MGLLNKNGHGSPDVRDGSYVQLAFRGGILAVMLPIIPPGGGSQVSIHDELSHVPRGSGNGGHWQSPMQLGGSGVPGVVEGGIGVVVVTMGMVVFCPGGGGMVVPLQSLVFISSLISSIVRILESLPCQNT